MAFSKIEFKLIILHWCLEYIPNEGVEVFFDKNKCVKGMFII